MQDWEKEIIRDMEREHAREQARLDAQSNAYIARINSEIKTVWLNILVDNIECGIAPSATLKKDIKKAGLDYERLYKEASAIARRKQYNMDLENIKTIVYENPLNTLDGFKEMLIEELECNEDHAVNIISDIRKDMEVTYWEIVNKFALKNNAEEDSHKVLATFAWVGKTIEDFKSDFIKVRKDEQIKAATQSYKAFIVDVVAGKISTTDPKFLQATEILNLTEEEINADIEKRKSALERERQEKERRRLEKEEAERLKREEAERREKEAERLKREEEERREEEKRKEREKREKALLIFKNPVKFIKEKFASFKTLDKEGKKRFIIRTIVWILVFYYFAVFIVGCIVGCL